MLFIDISENQNMRNFMGLQKMNLQKHGKNNFSRENNVSHGIYQILLRNIFHMKNPPIFPMGIRYVPREMFYPMGN